MRDTNWDRNSPSTRNPFRMSAQRKPFLFSEIEAAFRTCRSIHDEVSDYLYSRYAFQFHSEYDPDHPQEELESMMKQCSQLFEYSWTDRPAILRCNNLARFLHGIGRRNASHLTKLILVFKPGFYREAWDEHNVDTVQTLRLSLELIDLFLSNLHHLALVFENDDGELYPGADGKTVFDIDGSPTIESAVLCILLDYEVVISRLKHFQIEGMRKDPFVWMQLQVMEKGSSIW